MWRESRRVERRDLLRSVAILQNECHLQGASWLGAISLTENDDALALLAVASVGLPDNSATG
jgi:hypothetical protein